MTNHIEIIEGLLTQKKLAPEPEVGQFKRFSWETLTSRRTGNQWIKIRNAADGAGQLCRVVAVTPTGREDQHGNRSFNIEISPQDAPQTSVNAPVARPDGQGVDTPRQHMMRAANLLQMAHAAARAVLGDDYEGEDARTLFIDAQRAGLVAQMPDRPLKPDVPVEAQPEDGAEPW